MHFPVGAPPGPGHIPWLLSLPKFQMQCHWQFLVFLPTLYFLANFAVSLSFRIGFLGTTHTSVFYRWQTKNHQQASERSFGHDSPTPQPCVCCQIKIRHLKKKKKTGSSKRVQILNAARSDPRESRWKENRQGIQLCFCLALITLAGRGAIYTV